MAGRVAGKVALVSGGASGIGEASAHALAREGAAVVIADRAVEAGEAVAAAISGEGGQARFMALDVTDEAAWAQVVAATVEAFGRLDVLVNSAGIGGRFSLRDTTYEAWRRILSVNLDGTFLGLKAASAVMAKARRGSIINISSVMGKVGSPGSIAYGASKGGVLSLTKAAALELAPRGVRVNSVHPGFIETPLLLNGLANDPNGAARRELIISRHAIGRMGLPREIADGIVFLASDESSFMTGSELVIDGGYTAL